MDKEKEEGVSGRKSQRTKASHDILLEYALLENMDSAKLGEDT